VLYNYIITAPRITRIVAQGKKTLFPNGYPGPSPLDPSPEEQIILREQLETRLSTLVPSKVYCLVMCTTLTSILSVSGDLIIRTRRYLPSKDGVQCNRPPVLASVQHPSTDPAVRRHPSDPLPGNGHNKCRSVDRLYRGEFRGPFYHLIPLCLWDNEIMTATRHPVSSIALLLLNDNNDASRIQNNNKRQYKEMKKSIVGGFG
jgi:hypothetical protein